MASGAGSRDPDQAARILGVPPDATRETVEQAYHDLREVWNPERFGQDDRLRKKAEEQLREIEDAYVVLRRRSLPDDPLYELWAGKTRKSHPPKPAPHRVPETKSTSLVDNVFAADTGPKRKFPVWALVLAAILVCVLGAWWMSRRANEKAANVTSAPPMAAPPPVATNPQPADQPPVQRAGEPEGTVAAPGREETSAASPETPSQQISPRPETPLVGRKSPDTAEKQPRINRPAQSEIRKAPEPATKPPEPSGAAGPLRLPGEKPQLARGAEDEQAEAARRMEAFNLLRAKSEIARRLIDGNIGELRFIEWQAMPRDSGQVWIDVIAISSGQSIHFIWATDPAKQTVRPLSQAARDLEAAAAKR